MTKISPSWNRKRNAPIPCHWNTFEDIKNQNELIKFLSPRKLMKGKKEMIISNSYENEYEGRCKSSL